MSRLKKAVQWVWWRIEEWCLPDDYFDFYR
jgi:hypothetical protein